MVHIVKCEKLGITCLCGGGGGVLTPFFFIFFTNSDQY